MKVGVYLPDQTSDEMHERALRAMYQGIQAFGEDEVFLQSCLDYRAFAAPDVAVTWGVLKKLVPLAWNRSRPFVGQTTLHKNALVLERGFIQRDTYYHVGWNGLNGNARFARVPASPIAAARAAKIGWEPENRLPRGDHILVVGQVPWDCTVQDENHPLWLQGIVQAIMLLTDRPIILRPHPLALDHTPVLLGTEHSVGRPLEEDLARAHAVVTWNSTTAVEALWKSRAHVFALNAGSMAWSVANKQLALLEEPYDPADGLLQKWAEAIAYAQWSAEEMASGEAWEHARTVLPHTRIVEGEAA